MKYRSDLNIVGLYGLDAYNIYCLNSGYLRCYGKGLNLEWEVECKPDLGVYVSKEIIVAVGGHSTYSVYKKNSELLSKAEHANILTHDLEDNFVIYDRIEKQTKVKNLINPDLDWNVDLRLGSLCALEKNELISNVYLNASSLIFFCRGKEVWRFDTDLEIHKIIGRDSKYFYLACSENTVLAIDRSQGSIRNKWHSIPDFKVNWMGSFVPRPEQMVLDKSEKKLVGIFVKHYWEFDLQTNSIKVRDLTEYLDSENVVAIKPLNHYPVTDAHICVTAEVNKRRLGESVVTDQAILLFNKKTLVIEWRHVFCFEDGINLGVEQPTLSETNLIISDTLKRLHVFQK